MTDNQKLLYELQLASSKSEAFNIWSRYQTLLSNSALILSFPGESPLSARLFKTFGQKARLISIFAENDLYFLNAKIYEELGAGRSCTFPISYAISFDTNAASFLRALFAGREMGPTNDLRELLRNFRGNRLNWHVIPYLMENAEAIAAGENSQDIFETILATEKVQGLDAEHFIAEGEIRLKIDETELVNRAAAELSNFARQLNNGLKNEFIQRWEVVYVTLLFMTLLQIKMPAKVLAAKKLRALVEFMDCELHAMLVEILNIALEWFVGGNYVGIFNRLQRNAPDLVDKAKNISWDILHLLQLRQEATYLSRDKCFSIPYFLTFDQALADLMQMCAIKGCLIPGTFQYPVCFPPHDPMIKFDQMIGGDSKFTTQYLSPEANARRLSWMDINARPDLSSLRRKLETELSQY